MARSALEVQAEDVGEKALTLLVLLRPWDLQSEPVKRACLDLTLAVSMMGAQIDEAA